MTEPDFLFSIEHKAKNSRARVGKLQTPHGEATTPAFVIVGTKATVKAVQPEDVEALGAQIVLANTYHLYLQPGESVVREAGGLHDFMHWNGPMMTDSGGFQVYSLGSAYGHDYSKFLSKESVQKFLSAAPKKDARGRLSTIQEDGVLFRSHINGSEHFLTPEKSMQIQHDLGADMIFAFDECTSPTDSHSYQREAMERTHRWAERSLAEHKQLNAAQKKEGKPEQALFGIVQGGPHRDLREESAKIISALDFDGIGIGGSYTKEDMEGALGWIAPLLPEALPKHLLGIGTPEQILMGVEHGIDTFDCVAPSREARNGRLYTENGRVNIFNAQYTRDFSPVDPACACRACAHYTRAYLSHLFRAKELLGFTLATIHNLTYMTRLMEKIRTSIAS